MVIDDSVVEFYFVALLVVGGGVPLSLTLVPPFYKAHYSMDPPKSQGAFALYSALLATGEGFFHTGQSHQKYAESA